MLVGHIPVCIAPHQCQAYSLESYLPKETAAKSLTLLYGVLHSELKNSHRVRCDQERLTCVVPGLIPAGSLIIKELNAHLDSSLFALNAVHSTLSSISCAYSKTNQLQPFHFFSPSVNTARHFSQGPYFWHHRQDGNDTCYCPPSAHTLSQLQQAQKGLFLIVYMFFRLLSLML